MHKEKLIEDAPLIFLAKLKSVNPGSSKHYVLYEFDVLEVLKGKVNDVWLFSDRKVDPQLNHYSDHTDKVSGKIILTDLTNH